MNKRNCSNGIAEEKNWRKINRVSTVVEQCQVSQHVHNGDSEEVLR